MSIESLLHRTYRPPESPHTPGISPTPSPTHITHIVIVQVLLPSTSRLSYALSVLNISVAASLLKLSRAFHLNITLTQTSPWLPLPSNTWTEGENAMSPRDILKKLTGAKKDPLEPDITLLTQTTLQF